LGNAVINRLIVKLAETHHDIEAAQRLRFRVFSEELGAKTGNGFDADAYDQFCDHLLVLCEGTGELVGTYRLLRQSAAGFYSQQEFDIAALLTRKPDLRFLELGRSCILKPYRGKAVLELLWQGIWDYARGHKIDVMFGCASFASTDISAHAEALSFLAHHAGAPPEWSVSAHPARHQNMNLSPFNNRKALALLPPLIKAYLRLGCYIGDGAVIDHAFNTVDVMIILPVAKINPKYFKFYGAPNH
jgi:L-ornithine Nalpha-acyltransferase